MRSLVLAVLLIAPAFAGCVNGSFVDRIRNDLEAEDEHEERTLLSEEVGFSPVGIADPNKTADGPEDASTQWNETVPVPEGTRSLTVLFAINFSTPSSPDPVPTNPPDGEVRVYVKMPSGEERSLTRSEPAQAGFDFTNPDPGGWTVGMDARGNGTVTFNVHAIVPVQPSS